MASLNIRVGASIDRSLTTAYQPLIEAAKRAKAAIDAQSRQAGRAISSETRKGTKDAEARFRELEREVASGMPRAMNAGTKAVTDFARHTTTSFSATKRSFADLAREAEKEMARIERAHRRANAGMPANSNGTPRAAGGAFTSGGRAALGIARSAGNAAFGLATGLARSAGVEDFASLAKANTELEKNAYDLVNAGFMPGKAGAAGQRQDPAKLIAEIRKAAMGTGATSGETVTGLQAFVGKTGDLETGRNLMVDMGRLSKASGASLEDMMDAAGDVANALGDTENKGAKVEAVMRAIAAQGKEGAVEIKDLAVQMAKLGAASGAFAGDHATTVAAMGALAQMSRAKGGSAGPAQAATSVLSFVNTFDKGARERAMKHFGVQTRDATGKLLDPKTLITSLIRQASSKQFGGMASFSQNMGQMVMDAAARRTTRGFETIYKDAGGGAAGIAAVEKAYDQLANTIMDGSEITASFNAAMQTSDAKAKQFNEQWAASIAEVQTNILPAIQALAPVIMDGTKKLAEALGWLTGETKKKDDASARAADMGAQEARLKLRRDVQEGKVEKGDIVSGETALATLDAKIEKKKKTMATEPGAWDKFVAWGWGAGALGKKMGMPTTDEILEGENKAAGEDKRQLESMSKERVDLAKQLSDIKSGVLKVEIVSDLTSKPDGPPGAPTNGRTPSPEGKAGQK